MGKVISLTAGRHQLGRSLPKPKDCAMCGDRIETARLQVQPKAKRCLSCEQLQERRYHNALASMGERDIAIIRR